MVTAPRLTPEEHPAVPLRLAGMAALIGTLATAYLLGACTGGQPKIAPHGGPSAAAPADVTDPAAVKALCDFFDARALQTLTTADGHRQARQLADARGVPADLTAAAGHFYDDGITADTAEHIEVLDRRYAVVIQVCLNDGWVRP